MTSSSSSETALVDGISRALGVPHPFVHEPNPAFTLIEDWQQLACLVATEPMTVKPVGYYRSPESVDIYVFECSMGTGGDAKTWKIYRRYRQFQQYVSQSSHVLLADMAVPRLSQAYLKIFYAKQCKDRLVELHAWLAGVIDTTQRFSCQQAQSRAADTNRDTTIDTSTDTSRDTSRDITRKWLFSQLKTANQAAMPALWLSAFVLAGANTPFPHVFRGLPAFALALEELNVELTHAAPMLPSKLRSSIETHAGLGLRLTPSREVSTSMPNGTTSSTYIGATVSGFLRDATELDARLANVPVGAKLVGINSVDVADAPFDAVLSRLRAVGLPLRLRFVYNPHVHRRARVVSSRSIGVGDNDTFDTDTDTHRKSSSSIDSVMSPHASARTRRSSSSAVTTASGRTGTGVRTSSSSSSAASAMRMHRTRSTAATPAGASSISSGTNSTGTTDTTSLTRRYSMDSRKSLGIFSAVFGDLFGRRSRHDTVDTALLSSCHESDVLRLVSWDDVEGATQDVVTRGFFSLLAPALRLALEQREQLALDDSALLAPGKRNNTISIIDTNSSSESVPTDTSTRNTSSSAADKMLSERRAQGVWSTSTGPLGLSLGACKLRGVEAAMLELPPQFFSARLGCVGSEKHLAKGYVLVSINNESTFGRSFAAVMRQLAKAARPTAICFRWFQDYSPYLETDWAERLDPTADASTLSNKLNHQSMWSTHVDTSSKDRQPSLFDAHALACLADAQADLCSNLHLALVENATIRNEVGALEDALRRDAAGRAQSAAQTERIAKLELELATRDAELRDARLQSAAVAAERDATERACAAQVDAALAAAKRLVADHETRLVRESNRSIATARAIAERQFEAERDAALAAAQRRHDAYLQQLAEEHAEEVESLAQQVAVWRHQVEVLTEAEKRNYAALVASGVQPYGDPRRSRFGGRDDRAWRTTTNDEPASSVRPSASKGGDRTLDGASKRNGVGTSGVTQQQQMAYESWRDGTPEDPHDLAFLDSSDSASPDGGGGASTFWTGWFGS